MAGSIYAWSTTAASNASLDGDINWNEGQAPSTVNNSARQMMARVAEWVKDQGALTAGGTANAITVTANSAFTSYATGQVLAFKAAADNTGATTLSVNSIGARSIRKFTPAGESALEVGDIKDDGIFIVHYDAMANSAAGGWILLNPLTVSGLSSFKITSADPSANVGPTLSLYRNSASPAAADLIGEIRFVGRDSSGEDESYASISGGIAIPTNGAEVGVLSVKTKNAASASEIQWGGNLLNLIGSGSSVGFGSADVILTHSSSLLTLSGGGFSVVEGSVRVGQNSTNQPGNPGEGTVAGVGIAANGSFFSADATTVVTVNRFSSDGVAVSIRKAGVQVGSINVTASATAFNTSSCSFLKTNVRDFDAGHIVDGLRVCLFDWMTGGTGYGVIAQEANAIFPDAVSPGVGTPDDGEGYTPWSVDYSKFVPLLLKEVQSLRVRVAALEEA